MASTLRACSRVVTAVLLCAVSLHGTQHRLGGEVRLGPQLLKVLRGTHSMRSRASLLWPDLVNVSLAVASLGSRRGIRCLPTRCAACGLRQQAYSHPAGAFADTSNRGLAIQQGPLPTQATGVWPPSRGVTTQATGVWPPSRAVTTQATGVWPPGV
eukprot:365443-Chlamydomonas_euryale.AAC.23